jgi:hypothetical protein
MPIVIGARETNDCEHDFDGLFSTTGIIIIITTTTPVLYVHTRKYTTISLKIVETFQIQRSELILI